MRNSENVNAIKNRALIKNLFHIALWLISFNVFSQTDKVDKAWKTEKDKVEYRKERKYKGPSDWYADEPASMQRDEDDESTYYPQNSIPPNSANSPSGNQTYSQQQIEEERQKRYGKNYKGSGGGKPDPELIKPDPIEFPEFDSPDIDAPDIDVPDVDAPDFLSSAGFWQTLLFIILFLLAIWIVYVLIKNRKPSDKKVVVQNVENDWNPTIISKTELELLLEKAIEQENYRECVRIYFMFILKELTKNGSIKWRVEKTNYDYILEMRGKPNFQGFEETVRIYDIVWYGDYAINNDVFSRLQPSLEKYYQSLNPTDD